MENERRWEDLNVDCLVNVFGRVGMQSLLLDVPFVCKSWYTASLSPSCWEYLIFPGGFDGFDLPTHDLWSSEGELGTFMDRFRCIYRIDEDLFSVTAFLKVVVNRSRGQATVVRLPGFCSSEAMKYVADVCPRLKALYIDKIIAELIGKWKDLEELFLGSSIGIEKTLSEIGIHCKKFWRLHVGNAYICNDEALAIVKLVPNIKHLSLRQADIERDNLVTILQGCKELVALDVSDCRGFDEGDDEIYKLASHITNFRVLITNPDGFDLPTHDLWSSEDEIQTNIFGTFMNRFRCKYQIDERHFSVTAFIKFVVNRSRGHATFLRLPGCCTFEALKYVADVCPRLTALSLPIYLVHQRPRIIPQLIAKWKHLEELSLGSSLDLKKTLSEISIHCKKFWRLHVANAYIGNAEALAIVKLVPDIKHLSLRRADIGRDNLVMLLQGCKELVVLDVSDCRGFDEGDDEIHTLASHITNFRCEGSFSDCCTDCDDYFERNAVYLCAYESD